MYSFALLTGENMFYCKKCGKCCCNLNKSTLFADLNRGDGVCVNFDEKTKLCKIYKSRPLKCNVDELYNIYLKDKISKKVYYKLNKMVCKLLEKKYKVMGGNNMYLGLLSKNEKELFLGLAHYVSISDDIIGAEEKEMLKAYCIEMNLPLDYEKPSKPINRIIEEISSVCSDKSKKIIVFELIGLAYSDKNYDETEKQLIINIVESFSLDKNYLQKCEEIVKEYITFQTKINNMVLS